MYLIGCPRAILEMACRFHMLSDLKQRFFLKDENKRREFGMSRILNSICVESKRKCHSLNHELNSQIISLAGLRHGLSVTSLAKLCKVKKVNISSETSKCLSKH